MDHKKFLVKYRQNKSAVWIRGKLTNDEEFNYDDFKDWTKLKIRCEKENLFLKELYLQFKSHQEKIDLDNIDGIYLIRSLKGVIGQERNTHYYTVGKVIGDKVEKQMWITPELVVEKEYEDKVEECFQEAIIYDQKKKN